MSGLMKGRFIPWVAARRGEPCLQPMQKPSAGAILQTCIGLWPAVWQKAGGNTRLDGEDRRRNRRRSGGAFHGYAQFLAQAGSSYSFNNWFGVARIGIFKPSIRIHTLNMPELVGVGEMQ